MQKEISENPDATNYSHWLLRARLKTRQLLLVIALSEEGNIHRASHLLNMTQPAASKLLKDLEDVLGVLLFERLPRGMRPTCYGDTLIRHARAALASLNAAHEELQAAKNGQFGQVNLGSITTAGVDLLPATIAAVKQAHPNLRINIHIESSNLLIEMLERGTIDIMVGRLLSDHEMTDVHYQTIADEPVCAVARPHHPLLDMAPLALAEMLDFCWIVPPVGSVMRYTFDLMFQALNLSQPKNRLETSSLLFVTKMLQQSDMIAIMARDVARYYAGHGMVRILPVLLPCEMEPFGFITRRDRPLSPAAEVVFSALKAAAQTVYAKPGIAPAV